MTGMHGTVRAQRQPCLCMVLCCAVNTAVRPAAVLSGVVLVREFTLAPGDSTHLTVRQVLGALALAYSRTFDRS